MPFIISKELADKVGFIQDWTEIWRNLSDYQSSFSARHENLRVHYHLDFGSDCNPIELDLQFFYDLIRCPEYTGHYLVAQYVCDSGANGYKNLGIVLCVKRLRNEGEEEDEIISPIFKPNGDIVADFDFLKWICNYIKRRLVIANAGNGDFKWDREGRAHKIGDGMRATVAAIIKDRPYDDQGRLKPMYLYFVIDSPPQENPTISVAFASDLLSDLLVAGPPVAYDHGTACCPIG